MIRMTPPAAVTTMTACVDVCPIPFLPNTEHDCVCPVGTTGNNCSESELDNSIILFTVIKTSAMQGIFGASLRDVV